MPRLRFTLPSPRSLSIARTNVHARSRSRLRPDEPRTTFRWSLMSSSKPLLIPPNHAHEPLVSLLPSPISASSSRRSFLASLTESSSLWLSLYFFCNLTLTLYNKGVLVHFPFPYTLTALHAFCGSIGTAFLARLGVFKPTSLSWKQTWTLLAFSMLYSVNILVSNISLKMVTVPFHQVVRAVTPLFTMLFYALLLGRHSSQAKVTSLGPVVIGVALATYGDYYFTMPGFLLTLLGTVLAALKTVFTEILQAPPSPSPTNGPHKSTPDLHHRIPQQSSGNHHDHTEKDTLSSSNFRSKEAPWIQRLSQSFSISIPSLPPLSSINLLHLLSPLAFLQTIVLAYCTGELERVKSHLAGSILLPNPVVDAGGNHFPPVHQFDRDTILVMSLSDYGYSISILPIVYLLLNGILAFALNVVSFGANRRVGAVSMSVAANVKQVLTILCAVTIFDLTITTMNGFGIALTLIGGAWYAYVELKERQKRQREKELLLLSGHGHGLGSPPPLMSGVVPHPHPPSAKQENGGTGARVL
ncbi:hypothetical protein AX16_003966 [Volvariella volvacea WC 439]|nr:hypothetical protein AX16_003966 [Volvariella volvacea WC 439]